MNVYLAAVRSLHISHGLSNPLQPGLLLKQTLRGIKRKHFWHRSKRCRLHSTFSPIFRLLSSPRVTMTRYDGPPSPLIIFLCSARANLQFFLATFSIRLFTSPALTHVYILLFWHGVSLPLTYKILNGPATTGFDPLYCSFSTLRLCWLRYEKEPRSSPSPWYRRQGYYTLVSPIRPTPRQQNIPRLFHLSLTTLSRYWPIPLQWS